MKEISESTKNEIRTYRNEISSLIFKNSTKIDETLVSLRFMKHIDMFLEKKEINQKEFAEGLDISPAFVSQLMSGSRKISTSFINKFEKTYNVKFRLFLEERETRYKFVKSITSNEDVYFQFTKNNNYSYTTKQSLTNASNLYENETFIEDGS